MPKYYVLEGKSPKRIENPEEWALWYSRSIRDRVLAHHEVGAKIVRTVFTGLDFGDRRGRPCLFDTYIWGKDEADPEWTETHCTYEAAVEAHNRMVEALRSEPKKEGLWGDLPDN